MKRILKPGDVIQIGEGRSVRIISIEGEAAEVVIIAPDHVRIAKTATSGNTRPLRNTDRRRKATQTKETTMRG